MNSKWISKKDPLWPGSICPPVSVCHCSVSRRTAGRRERRVPTRLLLLLCVTHGGFWKSWCARRRQRWVWRPHCHLPLKPSNFTSLNTLLPFCAVLACLEIIFGLLLRLYKQAQWGTSLRVLSRCFLSPSQLLPSLQKMTFQTFSFFLLTLDLHFTSGLDIERCEFFTSNGLRIRRSWARTPGSALWWNLSGPSHSSDASAEKNNREVSNSNPLMTDFNLIGAFDFDWENTVKSQPQI